MEALMARSVPIDPGTPKQPPGGKATGENVGAEATGGTNAGGTATGGTNAAGGTSAGGTNAGGTATGGTNAGGTATGATDATGKPPPECAVRDVTPPLPETLPTIMGKLVEVSAGPDVKVRPTKEVLSDFFADCQRYFLQ